MDLSAYVALGGFERVAVIIGALIIGYWGYRLYGRDKRPGLVFMGIACAVLVLALATGGAYLRSVGTSYQLAGSGPEGRIPGEPGVTSDATGQSGDANPATAAEPPQAIPADGAAAAPMDLARADADYTVIATRAGAAETAGAADATATSSPAEETAPAENAAETQTEAAPAAENAETAAETESATAATADVDLASSQELGGRIVSVKSDKVSLEWSRD